MQVYNLRESTRVAMRLFGFLLARDLQEVGPVADWAEPAKEMLERIDRLDVVGDERTDRSLEELARAEGRVWLELAEEGFFDETDFVGHVLWHFEAGGYPGSGFVQHLLRAIHVADQDNRAATAAGHPELVGLWRAYAEVPDGPARLIAVMDRK